MSSTTTRLLLVAAVVAAAFPAVASASCIRMTAAEQRERADVIFEGIALDNPTSTGVQRFRVTRYLKGKGTNVLRVATGETRDAGGGGTVTSVSLHVLRGQKWRIFGRGLSARVLRTSVCDGSKRLPR